MGKLNFKKSEFCCGIFSKFRFPDFFLIWFFQRFSWSWHQRIYDTFLDSRDIGIRIFCNVQWRNCAFYSGRLIFWTFMVNLCQTLSILGQSTNVRDHFLKRPVWPNVITVNCWSLEKEGDGKVCQTGQSLVPRCLYHHQIVIFASDSVFCQTQL